MPHRLDWSSLRLYFKPSIVRVLSFGKLIAFHSNYCKSWVFQSFNGLLVLGSFFFFLLAAFSGYFYIYPVFHPGVRIPDVHNHKPSNLTNACNVFDGMWIPDETYPLYSAFDCPFVERGFNCLANGRKDKGYLKWGWKPKTCDIPRLNVSEILEILRGKRVVFVGDSLSRTQWESMICLLTTGVKDKKSVFEVNGNKITKQIRFLGVRFSSHNFTVEFYRSVFLVQPGPVPKHAPKRVKTLLKLDKLDDISHEWIDSDILVFNTGHWWTPSKLFEMGWYFQVRGKMKLGMPISSGFKTVLSTWASWVENSINPNRTRVFFRTFESTHWSRSARQSCKVTQQPLSKTEGRESNPFSDVILNVVKNLSVKVTALHITPMTAFRSDGHVGTWSDNPSVPDCSHWCLPGVPDVWNELVLSFVL